MTELLELYRALWKPVVKIPGKVDACDPGNIVIIHHVLSVCSRNVSAVHIIRENIVFFPLFLFLIKSIYLCAGTQKWPLICLSWYLSLAVTRCLLGGEEGPMTNSDWSLDSAQHPSS